MDKYTIFLILKNWYLNVLNLIIYYKLIDIRKMKIHEIILVILGSCVISIIYVNLNRIIWPIFAILIQFALQISMITLIVKSKIKSVVTKSMISNAFAYIGLVVAGLLDYPMQTIIDNKIINLIITMIIETLLIFGFFKIKRFKRGFAFVKSKIDNDYIDIAMINISALVILAYSLFDNYYGDVTKQILFTFIVVGIIMIIMIQKTLTLYYKQKLLQQNIESYKEEIKEKDEKIKELSDEKFKISKLNHEFYNR